tara:strand:+ start:56 stop:1642 length:1587 start_codon:yes stop_codon:yes gene_type:complete
MSTFTVAVATGTQYQLGGTGNVYTIDGSQPASFTFPWVEDGVLRLDQSGSSNDNHPLIFSTSNSVTLSLFKAGVISSGVTYYLDGSSNQSDYTNTSTFNAASTRYIEITPAAATDFYFGCWVHGISMGGIIDITQDTWGALSWSSGDWGNQDNTNVVLSNSFLTTASLGTLPYAASTEGWGRDTWGLNDWGSDTFTVPVTGFEITGSLGDLASAAATDGWGRKAWGDDDWGTDSLSIVPTGLSMTGHLGDPASFPLSGWGRSQWGEEPWGDSNSPVINITGLSMTGSLGTLPYAAAEEGWGRDEWGYGNWGENTTTVVLTTSFEMTGGLGEEGWGRSTWGNDAWGQGNIVDITIGHALTGFSITGSLGTPATHFDFKYVMTDSLLMTASRGAISINNGADHTQGLGGLAGTMSVGSLTVADVVFGPQSFLGTMSLTPPAAGDVQRASVTGFTTTMSLGSIGTFPDMAVGLSGFAITGSLGSITAPDQVIGLTGFEATGNLGTSGVSPLHYKDVDITGNTSYTDIEHSA